MTACDHSHRGCHHRAAEFDPTRSAEAERRLFDGPIFGRRPLGRAALRDLLTRYALELRWVADGEAIPGSYWGAPEAGLVGRGGHARAAHPAGPGADGEQIVVVHGV